MSILKTLYHLYSNCFMEFLKEPSLVLYSSSYTPLLLVLSYLIQQQTNNSMLMILNFSNLFNFFRHYKSPPFHFLIRIHHISLSYHISAVLPSHFSFMEQMLMLMLSFSALDSSYNITHLENTSVRIKLDVFQLLV